MMKSLISSLLGSLVSVCLLQAVAWASGSHTHTHTSPTQSSIGKPGDARQVTRTVVIDMTDDMRFNPPRVQVKAGETIHFKVKNKGQLKHEMVLGSPQELAEHYQQMLKFPAMEHDDPQMISVAPGQVGALFWTFDRSGQVDFACLQPGHFDAGMKGQVSVK